MLNCPNCKKRLLLRLFPDFRHCASCKTCSKGVDLEALQRAGIPSDLIQRIDDWARRSPAILGVGIEGALGDGLTDGEYLVAWKALREETYSLVDAIRRLVPVGADVVNVFDKRGKKRWTDESILDWRREGQRDSLVMQYGSLIGLEYRKRVFRKWTDPLPPTLCPVELVTKKDQESFWRGFYFGEHLGTIVGSSKESAQEIASKLGIGSGPCSTG